MPSVVQAMDQWRRFLIDHNIDPEKVRLTLTFNDEDARARAARAIVSDLQDISAESMPIKCDLKGLKVMGMQVRTCTIDTAAAPRLA